jgi:hypothetical protein
VSLGGLWGFWHYLTHPPRAWMVRWQVTRYLKKQSGAASFRTDFPLPSKAEMAKAPPKAAKNAGPSKGKLTGKDFDTLASEYITLKTSVLTLERDVPEAEAEVKMLKPRLEQLTKQLEQEKSAGSTNLSMITARMAAVQKRLDTMEKTAALRPQLEPKQTALAPIVSDLWDFQRLWAAEMEANDPTDPNTLAGARAKLSAEVQQKIAEARSYDTIYRAIGQELWVVEQLLGSANPAHRRVGVSLAMETSRQALEGAQNGWVATSIVQGYVWPNLDVATDSNRRSPLNLENLLDQCAQFFRDNDDFEGMVRNYKKLLAMAQTPQRMDQARAQIAMAYQQGGELEQAIYYLRQIKATNDFRWAIGRIPWLERQLSNR